MGNFVQMFEKLTYNSSSIHFGPLSESSFQKILNEDFASSKKVIITDANVYELWITDLTTNYPALAKAEIIQIPAGEENKTIEVCTQIWAALSEYEISRNDLIINFGGGVITDLGGFVASLFKRGLKFINIPTTLLSMVDASVGGKTGVDLGPYKNQIGVFSDAEHVFIDEKFLETLPSQEIRSGFAEMIKHGLIADVEYWTKLKDFDPLKDGDRLSFICHSVALKRDIVSKDHQEGGLRKILNFGHTVGHAIEGYFLAKNKPILHGFAVATGMMAESFISMQMGLLSANEYDEIINTIEKDFEIAELEVSDYKKIIQLMHNDKKNHSGIIQFSLLEGIGRCVFDQEVSDKLILESLKSLKRI